MTTEAMSLTLPEGLSFEALRLTRDPVTGDIEFDWSPIEQICAASRIDPEYFRCGDEDRVGALITAWYRIHIAHGGSTDPVQEQLIAEIQAEDEHGEVRVQRGPGGLQ